VDRNRTELLADFQVGEQPVGPGDGVDDLELRMTLGRFLGEAVGTGAGVDHNRQLALIAPAPECLGKKVKLVGAAGDASIMKDIGSTQAAWTIAPNVYSAWVMFDAMARLSVGERLPDTYASSVYTSPTWVVDNAESAKLLEPTSYDWYGPAGFEQQFKALWRVRA
jgi:hypothetical protein